MIRNLPRIFFFIPIILIFLFATPAFALPPATAGIYYVRTDGNDLNSGTENTPSGAFKTIQKAADTTRPGDTVEVQSGTYNESVLISISGESTRPITYRANGEVIINGQNTRAYCLKLQGVNFILIQEIRLKLMPPAELRVAVTSLPAINIHIVFLGSHLREDHTLI